MTFFEKLQNVYEAERPEVEGVSFVCKGKKRVPFSDGHAPFFATVGPSAGDIFRSLPVEAASLPLFEEAGCRP